MPMIVQSPSIGPVMHFVLFHREDHVETRPVGGVPRRHLDCLRQKILVKAFHPAAQIPPLARSNSIVCSCSGAFSSAPTVASRMEIESGKSGPSLFRMGSDIES